MALQLQECYKCKIIPDNVLTPTCEHYLCLNCAFMNLTSLKNQYENCIVCQFCGSITQLQPSSIQEISKNLKHTLKSIFNQSFYCQDDNFNSKTNEVPPNILDISHIEPIKKLNHLSYYEQTCQLHQGFPIIYFCNDCKCKCICPECVIHGSHKYHQVQSLKLADKKFKQELQIIKQQMKQRKQKIQSDKIGLLKNLSISSLKINKIKIQILQNIKTIKKILQDKQFEIQNYFQIIIKQNQIIYNKSFQSINEYTSTIQKATNMIEYYLQQSQINFLNFYAREYKQLQDLAQQRKIDSLEQKYPSRTIIENINTNFLKINQLFNGFILN